MPASPCRTYSDPEGKAAWEALNAAETRLESLLREIGGTVEIAGMGYFIDAAGDLMWGPLMQDGTIERESALHRNDYEGLSAQELLDVARSVSEWLDQLPKSEPITAAGHERVLQWNGFEVISTGGGCTAWSRMFPSGHHVMVTNEDIGHTFESDNDRAIVCAYDADSQQIGEAWEGPLSAAHVAISIKSMVAMKAGLAVTNKQAVVDEALDAAARVIQDALGVKTGDTAGAFFSGEEGEKVLESLSRYFDLEVSMLKPGFEIDDRISGRGDRIAPRG